MYQDAEMSMVTVILGSPVVPTHLSQLDVRMRWWEPFILSLGTIFIVQFTCLVH